MPGKSFKGPLPPLTLRESAFSLQLHSDVVKICSFGERTPRRPKALKTSADWIESQFKAAGLPVTRLAYEAAGQAFENIEAVLPGTEARSGVLILGAHFDTVEDCVGANDNGTGVASLLSLARVLADRSPRPVWEVRFVAFTMEEYYFSSHHMGSMVYAENLAKEGKEVAGMLSLETMGCYSDRQGSQKYPLDALAMLYPSQGDFITFVGNHASARLVRKTVKAFRKTATLPSEGLAAPEFVPGIGLSDHRSFWKQGYPALMVTDTAMFRYPYYHSPQDTPDKVDFDRLARVVAGLEKVVEELANQGTGTLRPTQEPVPND